jgi:hypothetical protein
MTKKQKDIDLHNYLKKILLKLIDEGRYDVPNGVIELHTHIKAIVELDVFSQKDGAEIFHHFYKHLAE